MRGCHCPGSTREALASGYGWPDDMTGAGLAKCADLRGLFRTPDDFSYEACLISAISRRDQSGQMAAFVVSECSLAWRQVCATTGRRGRLSAGAASLLLRWPVPGDQGPLSPGTADFFFQMEAGLPAWNQRSRPGGPSGRQVWPRPCRRAARPSRSSPTAPHGRGGDRHGTMSAGFAGSCDPAGRPRRL